MKGEALQGLKDVADLVNDIINQVLERYDGISTFLAISTFHEITFLKVPLTEIKGEDLQGLVSGEDLLIY